MGLSACVDLEPVPEGGVSLGFYQPAYPQMVLVPGYPVYYAPAVRANYFFYDGLYWLYQYDNWYASSWYNGPWGLVGPQYVPYYVLRVPVRYYGAPPPYFRGWHEGEPPHWDQHWGRDWEEHHRDWRRWDHRYVPPAAPLPAYQQRYSGDHYPRDVNRQQAIRDENYHYAPRDDVTQGRRPPPGRPAGPALQPAQPVQAPVVTAPPLDVQRPPGTPASRPPHEPPHAQPPLIESPPAAAPAPVQLERREPLPTSTSLPPARQRQPPTPTEPPPSQPRHPIHHPDRETSPAAPEQAAPVPAPPASQPEPHQHRSKRPPEVTPPPATDTDPPAQTPRSGGDNKARVDQP